MMIIPQPQLYPSHNPPGLCDSPSPLRKALNTFLGNLLPLELGWSHYLILPVSPVAIPTALIPSTNALPPDPPLHRPHVHPAHRLPGPVFLSSPPHVTLTYVVPVFLHRQLDLGVRTPRFPARSNSKVLYLDPRIRAPQSQRTTSQMHYIFANPTSAIKTPVANHLVKNGIIRAEGDGHAMQTRIFFYVSSCSHD